ncbi:hypothetical protein ACTHOQ_12570 [Solibacillus silvestris]
MVNQVTVHMPTAISDRSSDDKERDQRIMSTPTPAIGIIVN